MELRSLLVPDAFELTPKTFGDDRGTFLEWYRFEPLAAAVGHPIRLAQANLSVSRRGTLRGLHFADVPRGQAKYVTCVRGAVLDAVVDIRTGSPTFGTWDIVRLDEESRRAVYLPEGLGHAFLALTDDATVSYLCSEVYNPTGEHGIDPLDPDIGIGWPTDVEPVLSAKDAAAPSLAKAQANGLLPDYATCRAYAAGLSAEAVAGGVG